MSFRLSRSSSTIKIFSATTFSPRAGMCLRAASHNAICRSPVKPRPDSRILCTPFGFYSTTAGLASQTIGWCGVHAKVVRKAGRAPPPRLFGRVGAAPPPAPPAAAPALAALAFLVRRRVLSRRELERRSSELDALVDFGRSITQSRLDVDALCELIPRKASQIVDTSSFHIGLFEDDQYAIRLWIR